MTPGMTLAESLRRAQTLGLDRIDAQLLHRLAQVYIGPGTDFPPMPSPP